ncbi:MAG: hypothetical protein D6767_00960 [Candidatus Hydrogenedentota bacterium]|nr:MAG: hypothetical protein D6767_00960 [Candidatus Hydrogenedentota bacterium]
MKKILAIMILVSVPLFAAESEVAEESYQPFTLIGKTGELRLSSNLYYQKLLNTSLLGWKGVFDYYITDVVSITGVSMVPFSDANGIKPYFLSLGMNIHFWHVGDIDFFAGGTAGFTIITHELASTKAQPTVTMGGGLTFFGDFFNLTLEYQYHYADYTDTIKGNLTYYDLNAHVLSAGIGFRI